MEIKTYQAALLRQTLTQIKLQEAKDIVDTVVDLDAALFDAAKRYQEALSDLQKEAQGKTPEEASELLSAKTFDKIANEPVNIDASLSVEQIKAIGKHLTSTADMSLLHLFKK